MGRVDPPGRPHAFVQPDVTHAARCFQELMRRQGICESLRRAIRRESDRAGKRRLRLVLRRAEVKERAAIQAYQKALTTVARAILAKYYPDHTPK
ncbi:MAG: hypothetical protein IT318_11585 [Anaerolineales bacterium]|nr:hypothetical protein [Anaerolineales bacterium]